MSQADSPVERLKRRECLYCGHDLGNGPGHYVPPSFGDPGFPACEALCEQCKTEKEDTTATGP